MLESIPQKKEGGIPITLTWWVAAIGYSLSMVCLLLPLLLQKYEPKWDAMAFFLPSFAYLADAIREWRLPLWDPFTNCGYPFHADPQNYTLNPIAIFFGLVIDRPSLGFTWFWAFHWWWGGLGMIFFAWHLGATPVGAFATAISYALSGFFIGHAEHTSYIIIAAWLPWVFGGADRAVLRSDMAYALLAGAALGFCSYGGYPVLILFTYFAMGLWLVLRYIMPCPGFVGKEMRSLVTRTYWVALTLAVVAFIFIAVWSPILHAFFVEGGAYTDRVGQLAPQVANYSGPYTFSAALSLFFPFATIVGGKWMVTDISMTNAYMGILTIPLAIFWARKMGARSFALIFFVFFMFVVSLGGNYGLRTLLYYVFPPMRYMRFSAPFRLFWIFPVCLAAGLGLAYLEQHPKAKKSMVVVLQYWAMCACSIAILFMMISSRNSIPYVDNFNRLFAPGFLTLALCSIIMWGWGGKEGCEEKTWIVPLSMALVMLLDMSAHLYINSFTVWDNNIITRVIDFRHTRSSSVIGEPEARISYNEQPLGFMNVQQISKTPLVQGYTTMLSEGFNKVLCKSRFDEVMRGARFWVSPGMEKNSSPEQALAALSETGMDRPVPVLVESVPEGIPQTRVVPGEFGVVKFRTYAPEKIDLEVDVPNAKGAFLASTERFAAGWKVLVDGLPQSVQRVNVFFRGVFVPSGRHSVIWLYEPTLWPLLVGVSYSALFSAVAFAIVIKWRRNIDR